MNLGMIPNLETYDCVSDIRKGTFREVPLRINGNTLLCIPVKMLIHKL